MASADSDSPVLTEQRAEILDLAAAVVALGLLLVVATGWTGGLRVILAVLFTFFVPGRAVVSNWPRMSDWADVAMSIVISLGSLALLALVTLWLRVWHPETLFAIEAVLSLAGLAAGFSRRRRLDRLPTLIFVDLPLARVTLTS